MIDVELQTYLLSKSSITDIVGTNVWNNYVPQNVITPCITWDNLGSDPTLCLDGAAGYTVTTYQIKAWARDFTVAQSLGEAVRLCLQGYHGTWGTTPIGFVKVTPDSFVSEPLANSNDSQRWYKKIYDVDVGHVEAKPSF